jgi:hypothetical protein
VARVDCSDPFKAITDSSQVFGLGSTHLNALHNRGVASEDAGRFATAMCETGDALFIDGNILWPNWTARY